MLTPDQAKVLADLWRDRFVDEAAFEASWSRAFEMIGDPTAERLEAWLSKDLAKDQVRHAGIVKTPLLPTRSRVNDLSGCYHCQGRGRIRREVEISHPDFGKSFPCPACNGRANDRATHCPKCAMFSAQQTPPEPAVPARTIRRDYVAELAQQQRQPPAKKPQPADDDDLPF